jgi:hypothetical protein
MQAIEATGTIDAQGQLSLDQPLEIDHPTRVKVIVLLAEEPNQIPKRVNPDSTNRQITAENSQISDNRPIWERVAEISSQVTAEEWAKVPKDLSKNLDHYLYGSPKEDE